jgi:hypothetical protein
MLAYYLAWQLRKACIPMLFDDEQPPLSPTGRQGQALSAVDKARRKAHRRRRFLPLAHDAARRTLHLHRNAIRLHQSGATVDQLTPQGNFRLESARSRNASYRTASQS